MLHVHQITGRPWAVSSELADLVRGALERGGYAGLRDLAGVRSMLRAEDAGEDSAPRAQEVRTVQANRAGDVVAVIPVMGLLTYRGGYVDCEPTQSTAQLAATIAEASANQQVTAMVLEIDSPGGEVIGTPEAAAAIRDARASKPVVTHANAIAASAAYWLGAQGDEFWVLPSGQVGSIGVYRVHEDRSAMAEQKGVKVRYIYAGKYKVEGNPYSALGDEALAAWQGQVDGYYDTFVKDVARGRKTTVDAVRAGFGQGRMLPARRAVEEGMADEVGSLEQAIRRAVQLGGARKREAAAHGVAQLQVDVYKRGRL